MKAVCDLNALERSIAEVKRKRPPRALAPLFKHLINLARDSAKNGYCTRAGQELRHAKKLARNLGTPGAKKDPPPVYHPRMGPPPGVPVLPVKKSLQGRKRKKR